MLKNTKKQWYFLMTISQSRAREKFSLRKSGIPLLWLWGKTEVHGIKIL